MTTGVTYFGMRSSMLLTFSRFLIFILLLHSTSCLFGLSNTSLLWLCFFNLCKSKQGNQEAAQANKSFLPFHTATLSQEDFPSSYCSTEGVEL